jgi:hypothetical protein
MMRLLTGTPMVAEIRMASWWSFGVVGQRTSLRGRRAFMLDVSLALHRWLADDKKWKNPKASKREGCEMIIGIRWRVNL